MKTVAIFIIGLLLATLAGAEQQFEFDAFSVPDNGRIVIPVTEGDSLSGIAATIDRRTNGALSAATNEAMFLGETNATLTLYGISPYSRIDLIGLGMDTVSRADAENFGGTAASLLAETEGGTVQILWDGANADTDATAARVAFG